MSNKFVIENQNIDRSCYITADKDNIEVKETDNGCITITARNGAHNVISGCTIGAPGYFPTTMDQFQENLDKLIQETKEENDGN